eukprot:1083031-Prorocentrum_minimum.AAC.1
MRVGEFAVRVGEFALPVGEFALPVGEFSLPVGEFAMRGCGLNGLDFGRRRWTASCPTCSPSAATSSALTISSRCVFFTLVGF